MVCAKECIVTITDWRNNTLQYFEVFTPHVDEAFVDCVICKIVLKLGWKMKLRKICRNWHRN